MSNKEIIQTVIDAFDNSDVDAILGFMSDDVKWYMLGNQVISGKDGMRKFFATSPEMRMISSSTEHMIIEGDHVAVNGDVQCKGRNGVLLDMYYCDIYELENGKVKKMVTYTVKKNK